MDARRANDRIAEQAAKLRFVSRVPMLCECSAPDCRTIVMIGLDDFHAMRREPDNVLTTPGHAPEDAELLERTPAYEIHGRGRRDGTNGRRSA